MKTVQTFDFIFDPLDDTSEEAWKDYLDTTIFSETNHEKGLENFVFVIDNVAYDHSAQMSDSAYERIDRALEQIVAGSKSANEELSAIKDLVIGEFN